MHYFAVLRENALHLVSEKDMIIAVLGENMPYYYKIIYFIKELEGKLQLTCCGRMKCTHYFLI